MSSGSRAGGLDPEQIAARLAKASPAPWWVDYDYRDDGADQVCAYVAPQGGLPAMSKTFTVAFMPTPKEDHDFDAAFIAHAPEDIAALLAEVEALRTALRRLIAVVDTSPGAAETADAYNAARELVGGTPQP